MEKMLPSHQKRPNKASKNKKKEPIKVVYITNTMRFKASPSEFKALVQQLSGKDATYPPESTDFPMPDGVGQSSRGEAAVADAEAAPTMGAVAKDNVLMPEAAERKIEHPTSGDEEQKGLDPSAFRWHYDFCYSPQMIYNSQGSDPFDVLQSPDEM